MLLVFGTHDHVCKFDEYVQLEAIWFVNEGLQKDTSHTVKLQDNLCMFDASNILGSVRHHGSHTK